MSNVLHLTRAQVPAVLRNACPEYRGSKWKVVVGPSVSLGGTAWDGGSRSTYVAVDLVTGAVSNPGAGAFGRYPNFNVPVVDLPVGVAIVEHAIFLGRDAGCTIYLRPENAAPLLPAGPQATPEQRAVLEATATYKSSYGGDPEFRRHQAGLSRDVWARAKAECQAAGWLTAAGAITAAGRNVQAGVGGKRRQVRPGTDLRAQVKRIRRLGRGL